MRIRRGNLVASIGVLGLLTQTLVANAALVSETESFDLTPGQVNFRIVNDGSVDPPDVTKNIDPPTTASTPTSPTPGALNFNQFNPALGNLTGVSISLTSTFSLTPGLDVSFLDGTSSLDLIQFLADGSLGLSLTGSGFIAAQSPLVPPTASATCTTDDVACSDHPSATTAPYNATTPGLSLAAFTGTSTFDLVAAISSALAPHIVPDNATGDFVDNATIDGALNSNWKGDVKVTYTFEPFQTAVDEPLTLYLLIAGLLAFALLPRRRA